MSMWRIRRRRDWLVGGLLAILILGSDLGQLRGGDWLGFRGNTAGGGSVADRPLPLKCDNEHIAWRADLPGQGVSSPIVVGDQVIVTASSGVREDRLHVISLDVATGQERWHRQFWATGRTASHETSANAAPSPVSDGEHIVAFFSSNDVICLNREGELLWLRGLGHDYPQAGNDIGMASSPVIASGVVVCQVENQGDSFAEGIDLASGKELWHIERPRSANWSSPVAVPGEPGLVLLKGDDQLLAHHIRTGEKIWSIEGDLGGISSPIVADTRIYVPGGGVFVALDYDGKQAWDSRKIKPGQATPVVAKNRLFVVNGAILSSHDATSGEELWKLRVGGSHWATPVVSGEYIYLVNDAGELSIVKGGEAEGEKVDSHPFEEPILGSPAAANGALYLRSDRHLWKVAQLDQK